MSDKKTLKIAIHGDKEFKKAIQEIDEVFKVLGSEMNLVTAKFDAQDKSIKALYSRKQVLSKEVEAQTEKVSILKEALEKASAAFGENDKRTQSWTIQLNNAQAELIGMEQELKTVTHAFNEMGHKVEESEKFSTKLKALGSNITGMASQIKAAMSSVGDALGKVGAAVAKTVTTAMEKAGSAIKSVGKDLWKMANEAANTGERVDKMSQRIGMSTQSFQEWDYVISQNGGSIDTLKSGLSTLNTTVDGVINGNEAAAKKFERLGVSMDDLKGKSQEEIFGMTIAGLQGVTDESERAAIASELFGKEAVDLAPLLGQSADSIEELRAKAVALGLVMSEEAVAASVKFKNSLDTLQRTFSGLKNSIVAELLPGMSMVMEGLAGILAGQEGAGDLLKAGAEGVIESVSTMLPAIMEVAVAVISSIAEVAPQIINALVEGVVNNLPSLISAASMVLLALVNGLGEALPLLADGAMQIILALGGGIIANLPQLVEAALAVIATLASGIGDALPELIPAIIEMVLTIVTILLDNMDMVMDAACKMIEGLARGLIDSLPKLIEALPQIITGIVDFIANNLPLIIQLGMDILGALIGGLKNALPQLIGVLPQIVTALINGVGKAVESFLTIGGDLIRGLWKGIEGMRDWIAGKIRGFFSGIVTGVKDFLGIRSPSRLFATIGGHMAEGIGVGFEDEMDKVSDQITSSIPAEIDAPLMASPEGLDDVAGLLARSLAGAGELIGQMVDSLPLLTEILPEVMVAMAEFFETSLPELLNLGSELLMSLMEGLLLAIPNLVSEIPQIIEALVRAFGKAIPAVTLMGKNIVEGVWQGMYSMQSWLENRVTMFFSSIVSTAKKSLGIRSPSRVFAGIGGFMAEGLGDGFEAEMQRVSEQINRSIPHEVDTSLMTTGNLVNGLVSGLSSTFGRQDSSPIILQVNLDGKTVAQTIFDPLNDVSKQRGVAFG